ncbi:MAG: hypothetical protein AAFQ80_19665 [Cyanobacteria bacterium J06621_8]
MKHTSTVKFNWQEYLKYFSLKLLILLLISDLLFISIHGLDWLTRASYINLPISEVFIYQELLPITKDQSYAEAFQYTKELWIMLILGFGYWQRKKKLFLAWSLLFGYLLLDDFLGIHEKFGGRISYLFQDSFGLRAIDYGELLISATVGITFLLFIRYYYRQSSFLERKYCKILIFLLLGLAISGIIFDLIHVVFTNNRYLDTIFALLEDGGEQIVMSATLAFVYKINWKHQESSFAQG